MIEFQATRAPLVHVHHHRHLLLSLSPLGLFYATRAHVRECMRARQAHIEENINVFGFALTEREMIRIDELNRDRTSCMRGCSLAYTRRACTRPYAATHPRFSPLSFSLFCVRARA